LRLARLATTDRIIEARLKGNGVNLEALNEQLDQLFDFVEIV
jgi:hypothetical protein